LHGTPEQQGRDVQTTGGPPRRAIGARAFRYRSRSRRALTWANIKSGQRGHPFVHGRSMPASPSSKRWSITTDGDGRELVGGRWRGGGKGFPDDQGLHHGRSSAALGVRRLEQSMRGCGPDTLDPVADPAITTDNDPELAYARGRTVMRRWTKQAAGPGTLRGLHGTEPVVSIFERCCGWAIPFDTVQMPLKPFDANSTAASGGLRRVQTAAGGGADCIEAEGGGAPRTASRRGDHGGEMLCALRDEHAADHDHCGRIRGRCSLHQNPARGARLKP